MTRHRSPRASSERPVPVSGSPDRSTVRAFVRANHPDVGGDPAVFVVGLRTLRGGGEDWSRYDAPVVVVRMPGRAAGIACRVVRRLRGWHRRRTAAVRVR